MLRPMVNRLVFSGTHLDPHVQIFCYCQTVAGLLMWGTFSEERTFLTNIFILVSEYLRIFYYIFLSQILYFPKPEGPGLRIYVPQEQGGPVIHPSTGSAWDSSQSRVTTDGQSSSLSWYQKHICGPCADFITVRFEVFFIWGALSDERTGL
jgi:hypothetical protein